MNRESSQTASQRTLLSCALALAGALVPLGSALADPGDLLWDDRLHRYFGDSAEAIALSGSRVFAGGTSDDKDEYRDFLVRAYDQKTGDVLWDNFYDRALDDDECFAIAAAGARVFAGGYSYGAHAADGGTRDFVVRAYGAQRGDLLWEDTFAVEASSEYVTHIAAQGRYVVALGSIQTEGYEKDLLIRVYAAQSGQFLWDDRIDIAGGGEYPGGIAIQGRRAFMVGEAENASGDADILVRAYDVATGSVLWDDQYDSGYGDDSPEAVVVGQNRVFVGGVVRGKDTGDDWHVRAYDARTGGFLWADTFDLDSSDDSVNALEVKGRTLVAAGSGRTGLVPDDHSDSIVRAYYGVTGSVLWADQYDDGGRRETAQDVAVAGNMVVAVVESEWDVGTDIVLRALDLRTGDLLWDEPVSTGGHIEPVAIVAKGQIAFTAAHISEDSNLDYYVCAHALK